MPIRRAEVDRSVRLGARIRLAFVDSLRDPSIAMISLFARLEQLELMASVRSAGLFAPK